ncbi:MAG: hypothetical protein Fur0046_20270 [Cyanobacteria bacterium J069]
MLEGSSVPGAKAMPAAMPVTVWQEMVLPKHLLNHEASVAAGCRRSDRPNLESPG